MPEITELASGQLTGAASITIELVEADEPLPRSSLAVEASVLLNVHEQDLLLGTDASPVTVIIGLRELGLDRDRDRDRDLLPRRSNYDRLALRGCACSLRRVGRS